MGIQYVPDPVAYEVGQRTDAANAAGSLHAKVKESRDTIYNYLRNTVLPTVNKMPWVSGKTISVSYGWNNLYITGDNAYHDIVRITGPKIILAGYVQFTGNDSDLIYQLTIDNITLFSNYADTLMNTYNVRLWECGSNTARNLFAWRLPEGYQRHYTGSSVINDSFGGLMVVFPPLMPVQSALAIQYRINSSCTAYLNTMWGIWYVTA